MSDTPGEPGEPGGTVEQIPSDQLTSSTKKQIGPRVDAQLWENYKAYCADKNGKQGTTSDELEVAMQEQMARDGYGGYAEFYDDGDGEISGADQIGELSERQDLMNSKIDTVIHQLNQQ